MKFILTLSLLLLGQSVQAATHEIIMKSIGYEPAQLEIHQNDSIVWVNKAYTDHSATSDKQGTFDTGMVHKGKKSAPVTLSDAGDIPYHCSMHGKSMSGIIHVIP